MPAIASTKMPLFFCSDAAVQHFVEEEAWKIGPYTQPEFVMTAPQLFQAARDRFGDLACIDLIFYLH